MKINDKNLKIKSLPLKNKMAVIEIKYTSMEKFIYDLKVKYPIEACIEYVVNIQINEPEEKTSADNLTTKHYPDKMLAGTVGTWNEGINPLRLIMFFCQVHEAKLQNELSNYSYKQVNMFTEKLIHQTLESSEISDTLKKVIINHLKKIRQDYVQDMDQPLPIIENGESYKKFVRLLKNERTFNAFIEENLHNISEYFKNDDYEDELIKFLVAMGLV